MISDELRAEAKGLTDQLSGGQTAFHKLTYKLLAAIDGHKCPVSGRVSDELRNGIRKLVNYCRHHDYSQWAGYLQELLAIADAQPDWGNKLLKEKDAEIERLNKLCESLVGEETLHQEGQYKTEMDKLKCELAYQEKRWENGYKAWMKIDVEQAVEIAALTDAKSGWIEGPPKKPGLHVWEQDKNEATKFYAGIITEADISSVLQNIWRQSIIRHIKLPDTPPPPKQEPVVDCCDMGSNNYVLLEKVNWRLRECSFYCLTHCQWCGTNLPALEKQ